MTPEQQRIAVAEACGWTRFDPEMCIASRSPRHGFRVYEGIDNRPILMHPPGGPFDPVEGIPDYLNDLNAVHEAEKLLVGDTMEHDVRQAIYCNELFKVIHRSNGGGGVSEFDKIHADPAQCVEALLRTLNKWKDDK